MIATSHITRGLITLLIATHEPPSLSQEVILIPRQTLPLGSPRRESRRRGLPVCLGSRALGFRTQGKRARIFGLQICLYGSPVFKLYCAQYGLELLVWLAKACGLLGAAE